MTSLAPGGYGRIARPQCGSHEGLMLHQRNGEPPCVWCSGQGRAETGAIPPRDPPPAPATPEPRSVPEPSPEAPAAQFRYFLTAGGILLGTGEPGAALLALAESGDVTEIGAGQARELMAARNGGTG